MTSAFIFTLFRFNKINVIILKIKDASPISVSYIYMIPKQPFIIKHTTNRYLHFLLVRQSTVFDINTSMCDLVRQHDQRTMPTRQTDIVVSRHSIHRIIKGQKSKRDLLFRRESIFCAVFNYYNLFYPFYY